MTAPYAATLLLTLFAGCAVAPASAPLPAAVAPIEASQAVAEPAPANVPTPPSPPVSFAAPPVLLEASGARTAPADMPVPGYHCHWISPGKRYCHGGLD